MVTHLLVGNPTAQSGKNAERIEAARRMFSAYGIDTHLLVTLPYGRTVGEVAKAIDDGDYTHVVSMGGDGTFREVASGILHAHKRDTVALAMLPTGTANDQGKSFGLDANPQALATNVHVAVGGFETKLDAGQITAWEGDDLLTTTHFFDSAGWGISARILSTRNDDRRAVEGVPLLANLYRDQLVYAGAALRVFLGSYVVSDKFDVEIERNGHPTTTLRGLSDLIVKNTRIYAGSWVFDRTSQHDDGLFEVVPFHGKRDWTSKAILDIEGNPLTEEMLNTIGVDHPDPFRVSKMSIRFTVPEGHEELAAQIDGDEFTVTSRVEVTVLPRALRLIIPRPRS